MKKLVSILMGVFLFAQLGFTQKVVNGTVTDASDGYGIPGLNVVEKGTSNGTMTDIDGKYTLTVSDGATLSFSFLGMEPQEIAMAGQSVIDVIMQATSQDIDEVQSRIT